MFELSVASKYLRPRWQQLSVSIISLISILVIALVVWLIVVFFSVTYGLEKSWVGKLIALTAPIRITPTEAYYDSYYYQIDGISEASDYTAKTIGEKLAASKGDPYNPSLDEEPPHEWPQPLNDGQGALRDLVKEAFSIIQAIPDVRASDYEVAVATLHLQMQRASEGAAKTTFHQASFIGSLDPDNDSLDKSLLAPTGHDAANLAVQQLKGDGVLLPRGYRDAGVLAGDSGYLSYTTPTASAMQEQRIPIYVKGFYDPGIIPIGGKLVLVDKGIASSITAAQHQQQSGYSNGINLRYADLGRTDALRKSLQESFDKAGLSPFWQIESYKEYEFTRDVIQQLQSEKHLFSLLSAIIIIVACSNIVSMLIILVNDKKTEIGILRSMGATSWSIALIFGTCGVVMGFAGSIIGTLAALLTLHNLQPLINLLSRLQGYDMFNPMFYGETLPTDLSYETLGAVIMLTGVISLIAGLVPAVKACLLRPSAILKAE